MKKLILSIIFSLISVNVHSHVEHYNQFNSLKYELFRNNNLIGFHNYDFEKKNNNLSVKSTVEFKIVKLGIKLYEYKASSEENYENWIDEQETFESLMAKNNGKLKTTRIAKSNK